ncbi:hypothetical protein NEMBOFW57_009536 [Staphylotrichum longicolle]|uniref:Rhodopsin domain-containing protein n=1 Tax=Staphylotrichum longicolle TaxID=669026 RepID=A0AAD4EP74_9PEZI|nr:hypothetical protein NEMBOFW57_009536 [Staphylotrichum longicolle]
MPTPGPSPSSDERPHDDRGPMLLGVSWGLTALASAFLGLRLYCKLNIRRGLWWDDWILIAAWCTIVATDATTTVLVNDFNYGMHDWDLNIYNPPRFMVIIYSRATLSITAAVWTKTAFALTLLRLTTGMTKAFVWFIIISMNIAMGFAAMVPWIQCKPLAKGWIMDLPGTCWAPRVGSKIWIATGAYSAAMDFTLAILPWTFMWNIALRRKEKIGVVVAMSMGAV